MLCGADGLREEEILIEFDLDGSRWDLPGAGTPGFPKDSGVSKSRISTGDFLGVFKHHIPSLPKWSSFWPDFGLSFVKGQCPDGAVALFA